MAEAHPVGFQWVVEAKARGATVIHADPRYTRTSALADIHVPMRAGSDIAFLGGLINHVLTNDLWFRDYVLAYTNASFLVREDFGDTEELDGLFSGFDPDKRTYQTETWQYAGLDVGADERGEEEQKAKYEQKGTGHQFGSGGAALDPGEPIRDMTLQHPRCIINVLKRHFARYTPRMVEEVCGVPAELFAKVADALTRNSGRERTSAFAYAVGWTQHTVGVQYIRTAAIIQLLLGNMGRPGGGILALRGHANIQGSTDIPTLFNILPGYIPMAHPESHGRLDQYIENMGPSTGAWGSLRSYIVSLLKAWWGDAATEANDFAFNYLPRINGDHSNYATMVRMLDGEVKGFFAVGENPAVGSANGKLNRKAMASLDWLVVRDLVEIETATFWKDSPEIESGELRTENIGTEVFFMPAAAHTEKDGCFTNTQRLLQWHEKAVEPPEDCRSELHFFYHLGRRIREKLAGSTEGRDRPILDLTWDYPTQGPHDEPEAEAVLAEINGFDADGNHIPKYQELSDDGSTTCGSWIHAGIYADGVNQPARRRPHTEQNWIAPEGGWAWPSTRRILYNRASAKPDGTPWSERKRYVWWDAGEGKWTSLGDDPDFEPDKPPDYKPPRKATGMDAISGQNPFIVPPDGWGWIWAPSGLVDAPLPTHYEPHESPVVNRLYRQRE